MKRLARGKAPTSVADTKAVHARAEEIGKALPVADPAAAGSVEVYFDNEACTWAVQITVIDDEFVITVPTCGVYALWINGVWLGGTRSTTDDPPAVVAARVIARIRSHLVQRDDWLSEFTL